MQSDINADLNEKDNQSLYILFLVFLKSYI